MRALAAVLVLAACGGGDAPDATPPDAAPACGSCPLAAPICDEPAGACVECLGDADCDGGTCADGVCDMPAATGVDILFVMDDTASMDYRQTELAEDFPGFLAALDAAHGSLPELHVGVVTTDMGAGGFAIDGCDTPTDGALQSEPQVVGCTPPPRPWIENGDDLAASFACIVQLGVDGCGFEQPLAALQRALANPANAGFRVDGHALAIMILTDEDDCSAVDTDVFDPDDLAWGPLTSFRCFEWGVVCDPDQPREPGPKTGCRPRPDWLVDPVAVAADLLADTPRGWLTVSVFAGARDPIAVGVDPERPTDPTVVPSCQSPETGFAAPGIRLGTFADQLATHGAYWSICDDDLAPPLAAFAAQIASML